MKSKELKIVVLSDTHNLHYEIDLEQFLDADIFIHSGDFTMNSTKE